MNFTNIYLTQDNCIVDGNKIIYTQAEPLVFNQLWLH